MARAAAMEAALPDATLSPPEWLRSDMMYSWNSETAASSGPDSAASAPGDAPRSRSLKFSRMMVLSSGVVCEVPTATQRRVREHKASERAGTRHPPGTSQRQDAKKKKKKKKKKNMPGSGNASGP